MSLSTVVYIGMTVVSPHYNCTFGESQFTTCTGIHVQYIVCMCIVGIELVPNGGF